MSQIKFNSKITISLGRNGYLNTKGLYVDYDGKRLDNNNIPYKVVSIFPITSRDEPGRGWTQFPIEIIPDLIKELQELYDNSTTTPAVQRQSGNKSKST